MPNAPESVIDNAADQFKTAKAGTDATNAVKELEEVDSEKTYEELSADTAAIAAAGGLPGAMLIFDGNNDGQVNAADATEGSLFGYISGGDGKIGLDNNEGEFQRLTIAAQDGVILNEDGTVLRELTFEERVAAVMLLDNFRQIEAIGGDEDLTIGDGDFAAILGDQRQYYDETLYGVEAALTRFAPNGTTDAAAFRETFGSDQVDMTTLMDMQRDPAKYGLDERTFRGVQAMIENFDEIAGEDGYINAQDLVDYGQSLGIDMSDSAASAQIESNQQATDDANSEYDTAVGDDTAEDGGNPDEETDPNTDDDDADADENDNNPNESGDGGGQQAKLPESVEREMLVQGLFRENADGVNLNTLLSAADTDGNGYSAEEVQSILSRADALNLDDEQRRTLSVLRTDLRLAKPGTPFEDGNITFDELIEGTMYEGRTVGDLNNSNEFQPMSAEERQEWLGKLFGKGSDELTPFDALTMVPKGDEARTSFNEADIQRVLDNPELYGMTDAQVASLEELQKRFPEFDSDYNGVISLEEMQAGMEEQKTVEQLTEENNINPDKLKEMITGNYRFLKEAAGDDDILLGDEIDAALEKLPEDSTDPEVQQQREVLEYARDHYDEMAGKDGILTLDEMAKAADLDREELEEKIKKEDKVARAIIKNLLLEDAAVWTEISNGEPVTEARLEAVINDPDSSVEARKYAAKLLRYFEDISSNGESIDEQDLGEYGLDHGVTVEQMKDYKEQERKSEDETDGNGNGEGDTPQGSYTVNDQIPWEMGEAIVSAKGLPVNHETVYAELFRIMQATGGPVEMDANGDGILTEAEWMAYRGEAGSPSAEAIDAWWNGLQGQEITY